MSTTHDHDHAREEKLEKLPTGIEGFDDITAGGLPLRRTTLLMGGPGSGKTVLALQILAHGAISHDTPGIFVAFEENADRVQANAGSFGWKIGGRKKKQLYSNGVHPEPQPFMIRGVEMTACFAGKFLRDDVFEISSSLLTLRIICTQMQGSFDSMLNRIAYPRKLSARKVDSEFGLLATGGSA